MNRSKAFPIFLNSTRNIRWFVYDDAKRTLEANSVSAKILNKDTKEILNILDVLREDVGVFSATVDTAALGLTAGTYIIEFSCVAGGNNKAKRDFIKVKYTL